MSMSMSMILIPALLLYVGFLFWFITRYYLPRYYAPVSNAETSGAHYRLARVVRRILSVIHGLLFFTLIVWLPFWIVMTLSQLGSPEWGIDIAGYSGFRIDLNLLPTLEATGLRDPVISGKTLLSIDTSNRLAWNLFAISTFLGNIIGLYVVLQMRNIFVSLSSGEAFTITNSKRLKKIGVVIIAAYLAAPLVQYYGWGAVLKDISFNTAGIALYPAFELDLVGILIGLGTLVLSGVINEAVQMQDEQKLTI